MSEKTYKLGFIGCGHMGLAIARGAKHKDFLSASEMCVYDPSERIQEECRKEGFAILNAEKEVCESAHIVLLAVTPQICDSVLENMKGSDIDILLSIVTGVSIHHLQEVLGPVPVIRAMPNTPLQISLGSTAVCRSDNCPDEAYDFVNSLFSAMGVVREIPENQLNEMVCVHGSIPAYVYYLAECILNDMKERGINEADARDMLVQTFIGSGGLMQANPDKPLQIFIDEVCSKGGTTIEAITELRNRDLPGIIHDANEKCINRAKELGK